MALLYFGPIQMLNRYLYEICKESTGASAIWQISQYKWWNYCIIAM